VGDLGDEIVERWVDPDDEDLDAVHWSGRVRVAVRAADDGAPVEGAAVRVLVSWRPEEYRSGTTDARGQVELEACDRSAVIWVRAVGFLVQAFKVESDAQPVQVSLRRGPALQGRVVRASDQRPVEGAEVYVWDEESGEEIDYRPDHYGNHGDGGLLTDAEGVFSVAALPQGRPVTIAARASGMGIATYRVSAGTRLADLVLRLGEGGVLEGAVRLDDGKPAARVRVYAALAGDSFGLENPDCRWFAGGSMRFLPFCVTDQSGRYRMEGLPVPARYVPVAKGEEWALGAGSPATLTSSSASALRDIALVTPAWPDVRGHAPDGSPITPTRCALLKPDGSVLEDPFFSGSSSVVGGSGVYSLHSRPPGRWLLVAVAGEPWRPVRTPIELKPGENKTFDVTFEPGLALEGRVVDAGGKAVSGASVEGTVDFLRRSARTDDGGSFRLEGLPEGALDLMVEDADGYLVPASLRAACPATRALRIVLQPRPVVVGRIAPPPRGYWPVSGRIRTATKERLCDPAFDSAGAFRLSGVPVGEPFDLVLRDKQGRCPRVWRGLRAEVGTRLDLGEVRFQEGRSLKGVVSDAAGTPMACAHVIAEETVARRETNTDARGRFQLTGVPDHAIHIEVRVEGHATLRAIVDPSVPVALTCSPGVRVTGCLVAADAGRLIERRLRFVDVATEHDAMLLRDEATTDSVGAFEIRLTPGSYDVWTVREGTFFGQGDSVRDRGRAEACIGRIDVSQGTDLVVELPLNGR